MKVELSDEAKAQAEQIDAWWRESRPAAPDLFTTELDHGLRRLGEAPGVGSPYVARTASVRRLLLGRTHYHLYYIHEENRVYVVAIWSVFRGHGPRL